ncbi:MAG: phosphoribulokinase [Betaproteobacteria bacterium]|nr:phosphoribulokinase [Betaproteobacteria bacterium]MDE2309636.1 phosphoribulokinase [Betaproteobacteria bacterium]
MSRKYPVIVVTGSSGAGTTTAKRALENIIRREFQSECATRECVKVAVIEGDSMHSLDRVAFRAAVAEAAKAGRRPISHFGPEANHFDKIEETFRTFGETGTCRRRYYIHSEDEAKELNARLGTNLGPGQFTPWEDIPAGSNMLFYEGLHGMVKTDTVNVAKYVDLSVGVVPVVNLEWIQKIHRDAAERGYSAEATVDTILRRMPDYINYITPQFSLTDVNFQRVATVDTSNPFIARDIPTPDESFVVIRFRNPKGVNFPYFLNMIHDSFMSRSNTIVVPGGKMSLAMELILTPLMHNLIDNRNK